MTTRKRDDDAPIIIKKYANRRLYNTASSAYVTLEDLRVLVSEGVEFEVQDAKTGEDLTRVILTQILAEAEQSGASLLPVPFLRQVIAMYGDGMSWMLPQYLECASKWFDQHQDEVRRNMDDAFGGVFPVGASMDAMQEATQRNMAAFDQAMRAFWPNLPSAQPAASAPKPEKNKQDGLDDLRRKLAEMQAELDTLSKD
jgi:polyhydroxyalkanoate synthesis repressor PhaR